MFFLTYAYAKEVYNSEHVSNTTKQLRVILDAKYEKVDLHKVMKTQCQYLTMIQHNNLQKYYRNLKSSLMEQLAPVKKIQQNSN